MPTTQQIANRTVTTGTPYGEGRYVITEHGDATAFDSLTEAQEALALTEEGIALRIEGEADVAGRRHDAIRDQDGSLFGYVRPTPSPSGTRLASDEPRYTWAYAVHACVALHDLAVRGRDVTISPEGPVVPWLPGALWSPTHADTPRPGVRVRSWGPCPSDEGGFGGAAMALHIVTPPVPPRDAEDAARIAGHGPGCVCVHHAPRVEWWTNMDEIDSAIITRWPGAVA